MRCQRMIIFVVAVIFTALLFRLSSFEASVVPQTKSYQSLLGLYGEDQLDQDGNSPVISVPVKDYSAQYRVRPDAQADATISSQHPISKLVEEAKSEFVTLKASQSQTLEDAVNEYKRRYGLKPPPRFDVWFKFAQERQVQLVDEFDTVHHNLLPFWALEPAVLRSRVREAVGYEDNGLIALLIRDGGVSKIEGGQEWQRTATLGMLESFVHLLPDMDVAFNVHDEPRVVIPHDQLLQMVSTARDRQRSASAAYGALHKDFSARSSDMQDARRILKEYKSTRFNDLSRQNVWTPSILSCAPDTPSRDYRQETPDNASSYAFGSLEFISNETAFSNVCDFPSLRHSHGFFQQPNSYIVTHELIPIFSQSKVSSYQDILFPSPWYWYNKTVDMDEPLEKHEPQYDPTSEVEWEKKADVLWWRGSTTGGYSRNGGWRTHHRQTLVRKINDPGKAKILVNQARSSSPAWSEAQVDRTDYKNLTDVKFTGTGLQCDPGDCDAQQEYFEMAPHADSQDAWKYKYLLDMDGNAFSGRFYAFLRSKSLPFKAALFREWHHEWLRPWVHYVPLTLNGDEHLEAVRWFDREPDGRVAAERLARHGREWSWTALRAVDLEAWFFRLLLEYGRVVDDDRERIGFAMESGARL